MKSWTWRCLRLGFAAAVVGGMPVPLHAAGAPAKGDLKGEPLATHAWRCGADGRTYSDTPCSGGRDIALPAVRPAADVRAARQLARRDAAEAERLTREREAREAAAIAASASPASLGPVRQAARPDPGAKPGRDPAGRKTAGTSIQHAEAGRAQRPKTRKATRPAFDADAQGVTWQASGPRPAPEPLR